MKVVGLITEYNPFHNGHHHHIKEARKLSGADYCVVVMSGNYVQRGAPAFLDKYTRTRMALACGADLVLELPVCFAGASAEYFSMGAVSVLNGIGVIDSLCFGSECGSIEVLKEASDILLTEPPLFKKVLNDSLKTGKTFPQARMDALQVYMPQTDISLFSSPNNILGMEYIKALTTLNSNIMPLTIPRISSAYHKESLNEGEDSVISSATAIRRAIRNGKQLTDLVSHIPKEVFPLLDSTYKKTWPIFEEDFSLLLQYKLMTETSTSLSRYLDVTPDLANRIKSLMEPGLTFSEAAKVMKSKQWTLTRLNRSLLHILLNITEDSMKQYKAAGYAQYARILGIRKTASPLLRSMAKKSKLPLITKTGGTAVKLPKTAQAMFQEDLFSTALYNEIVYNKFGIMPKNEYKQGIILQD
ncbi:nucleotidyltransferase [Anaerocolumna xylanovorans]|uniref:tRNA(Met) cytidine acetate ligase n=1 Tax=Anaerocolumna xylanovorans DSM 12503 TaxID=1121345 RepID=A0A1M7YCD6_9FIRM|nr:nucleotidyltransferase [Anaerocolumna xylanovorans]SHO50312.1 Predicted nucleotidyltransferase [Anaerocolumna xylanovorans DSM 12503]